jgi:hypothetical protein
LQDVPLDAFLKRHTGSTEDIERAPNRKINMSLTQPLDIIQILKIPSATSIGNWYVAPLCQLLYQLLINALLETFVIRSVD